MGLQQWEGDPIWDIEALAAEAEAARACLARGEKLTRPIDQRAAWWCSPPAGRMSVLRSKIPNLSAGADLNDPNSFFPLWAVRTRPLDRISIWVTSITNTADLGPPQFNLQLRVGFECVPTIATTQVVLPPSWEDSDKRAFLFQWSGLLVTQFELWGVLTEEAGAGLPLMVYFSILVDHVGCCEPTVVPGPWVQEGGG